MSAVARPALFPGPLTLAERAAVGEDYFQRCYGYALMATVALAATALALAYGDSQRGALVATSAIAVLVAAAALAVRDGYEWLRRHPYTLVLAGPAVALLCLWHAIDANAVYFPALAPLAIVPCVAQDRCQQLAVIGSLAAGTFIAALEDTRLPRLQGTGELASSTLAVLVLGALLMVIIDWWARKVLLAPDASEVTPSQRVQDPDGVEGRRSGVEVERSDGAEAERDNRIERIRTIVTAEPVAFENLQIVAMQRLTGRQLQLLYLVRENLSSEDIAYWLNIKPNTVRTHIRNIRARLDVVGRGAATYALAHRLPDLPEGFPQQTQSIDHKEPLPPAV